MSDITESIARIEERLTHLSDMSEEMKDKLGEFTMNMQSISTRLSYLEQNDFCKKIENDYFLLKDRVLILEQKSMTRNRILETLWLNFANIINIVLTGIILYKLGIKP